MGVVAMLSSWRRRALPSFRCMLRGLHRSCSMDQGRDGLAYAARHPSVQYTDRLRQNAILLPDLPCARNY